MDLDRASRIFKLYCYHFQKSPSEAESMLLTDDERLAVQELKSLVRDYAGLFASDRDTVVVKAA